MTQQRDPYVTSIIEAKSLPELNEYLSRELRRIEYALQAYEQSLTVDLLEQTANVSVASNVMLNCSATAIVITLPSATRIQGQRFTFKKTDSGANKAAIRTVGTQTIDGATSSSLTAQYQVKTILSDGTNWNVV